MDYELTGINYIGEFKFEVRFRDDSSGIFDGRPYIRKGGVFAQLADEAFFRQARIHPDWGVLCWGDQIDIAPETLYEQVTGKSLARR